MRRSETVNFWFSRRARGHRADTREKRRERTKPMTDPDSTGRNCRSVTSDS